MKMKEILYDDEYVKSNKPVIMFLGDSFVWGYDVEKEERFTEKLRKYMPDWSIYNLGVSGYGNDQEYLLLQKYYDKFRPEIVFVVFCTDNDRDDNSYNNINGGYFKPYFEIEEGNLKLKDQPVPLSANYYLKDFYSKHPANFLPFILIMADINWW